MKLSKLLKLYKQQDVDEFLQSLNINTLKERNKFYINDIKNNWSFLGDNPSNASSMRILTQGEKGLIERITNSIDAIIEKYKIKFKLQPKDISQVIKKAFPDYWNLINNLDSTASLNAKDASDKVFLIVNDSSKTNKPTFDIIDLGVGINGDNFKTTILSIAKGNKISSDKDYLIGAFGQGGSTSIPFTTSTIILSKYNKKFYFTIIKCVELLVTKIGCYVYLHNNGKILDLDNDIDLNSSDYNDWIKKFVAADSGTFIRMIETDIQSKYRENEVTKPGMLLTYIDTQLFSVKFPIKIIDNRKKFISNKSSQNRYSYGSYLHLQTTKKHVKEQYSGKIFIEYNGEKHQIEYYVILPSDENEWGIDSKCKQTFAQYNILGDPIIYTVNGQTINSVKFTKLANAGLPFLKDRLLVIINLDKLGKEKYNFFTSNRQHIIENDITKKFLDKIIDELSNNDSLKEINKKIRDKVISSPYSSIILDKLKNDLKNDYKKYLINDKEVVSHSAKGHHNNKLDDEIFSDTIEKLEITSAKDTFFKDQKIRFYLQTDAQKNINANAKIDMHIDGKYYYDFIKTAMNGRILYTIDPGKILYGEHKCQFCYFDNFNPEKNKESNIKLFKVLDELAPKDIKKEFTKNLDIDINKRDGANVILDVNKNEKSKKITILYCLDHDTLKTDLYQHYPENKINDIKHLLAQYLPAFGLYYEENYNKIETDDEKNKLIVSIARAITFIYIHKTN